MIDSNIDFESALQNYWQYYLELEDEFLYTQKFVSFDEKNYNTFSIEFLKLFQAACSEVETLAKALALLVDINFNQEKASIKRWWFSIQDQYKYFANLVDCHSNPSAGVSLSEARVCFMEKTDINPWMGLRYIIRCNKNGEKILKLSKDKNPVFWWIDHNKVKHQRIDLNCQCQSGNYSRANLKNVIYSLGALYILEKVLLQRLGTVDDLESFIDDSKLFQPRPKFITSKDIDKLFNSSD